MVNQSKVLLNQDIMYRAIPLTVTIVLFLMIAPIPALSFMRNIDPVLMLAGLILFIDAVVLLVEFFRNLPDAGSHNGAKTGAYMFLVMSIILFIFGGATMFFDDYNPFANASGDITNLTLTAILGITALVMYTSVHPLLFTKSNTLAHAIRKS